MVDEKNSGRGVLLAQRTNEPVADIASGCGTLGGGILVWLFMAHLLGTP